MRSLLGGLSARQQGNKGNLAHQTLSHILGTFRAIRTPAYNGPSPHGYANSPIKNLTSVDLKCNVLGDKQVNYTIQVRPGDNLTFDW